MRSAKRLPPPDQDTRSTYDIIHDGTAAVRSIGHQLSGLARAFSRTGNAAVADELEEASHHLVEQAQAMLDAYQNQRMAEVDQSIRNSERFIGGIMSGLLAGKEPKDAIIDAVPHHYDRDLIEASGA